LSTELPLAGEFPPSTYDQWRSGVDKVLAKGKTDLSPADLATRFDRELVAHLYDGIDVAPLYTAADLDQTPEEQYPGFFPFVRSGSFLGGSQGGWDVRQPVDVDPDDVQGVAREALEQLERGASSLFLRAPLGFTNVDGAVDESVLGAILGEVYLDLITVSLDASLGFEAPGGFLELCASRDIPPEEVRGVLGIDPIGTYASSGGDLALSPAFAAAVDVAQRCVGRYPKIRGLVVDATRYHEAGCSDSEELAYAAATGTAYLRLLTEAGLSLEAALDQIEFRFAATADQFLTMAKLRAGRLMWSRIAQSSGNAAAGAQRQHVVTSQAMLSRYDPWVNLLRGTIACFSAGIGGADAVTVETYDALLESGVTSELGRRLARNTQIILLEESHAAKIIDPAGGSWYVESLTRSVARESWSMFQSIEAAGGMIAALDGGLVAEQIERTWDRRLTNLAHRKDTITGVSDFPNPHEVVPLLPPVTTRAKGLPRRRYAAPFEEVRQRADAHARATGERPSVLLVNLGRASDYTARTTYAKSFFETGGFGTDVLEVNGKAGLALPALHGAAARVACICSSDARYVEAGTAVVAELKDAGFDRIYLAGRKNDELVPLVEAGVDEFIGVGCNVLDVLRGVLIVFEVP
jgi:methylmalonyl-CoA mutase